MPEDTPLTLLKRIFVQKFYRKLDKNTRFVLNTRINSINNRLRYSAPADPYKILSVPTDAVAHRCVNIRNTIGLGRVVGGDWDLPSENPDVESYWRIKGLKERFEKGWEWHETTYYETVVEKFEEYGGSYWGYDSLDEFEERLAYNDYLFERISEDGYRKNLAGDANLPESDDRADSHRKMNQLEVLLCIGRDGQFLLLEGHHRFAIADILGIDIPVQILARHQTWQERRDQMAEVESIDDLTPELRELLDHPDMEDVRPTIATTSEI
jgi:hypothetical protein